MRSVWSCLKIHRKHIEDKRGGPPRDLKRQGAGGQVERGDIMGTIRESADHILYGRGLMERLREIGEPHIIGSYKMDMMAWNDLDIDVENTNMSIEKLYELTDYIIRAFHPKWFEAKEEVTDQGKTVWFQGAEAVIDGELWNFDLWFFDRETIEKAEVYCDSIASRAAKLPGAKERIIGIKRELLKRGLYGYGEGKYISMDVYRAVLEQGITDTEGMLESYVPGENRL